LTGRENRQIISGRDSERSGDDGGTTVEGLAEKAALVTGASRGIGRAIALELARKGAAVAVNYNRRGDLAEAIVSEIEAMGGRAVALQADVGDRASAELLVEKTVEGLGTLDILVNNAGIWEGAALEDAAEDMIERLISTNVLGMIHVTGRALPYMKKAGWGRVVNVSSVLGVTGYPGDSIYSATKSSMFGFSKALARETARHGITVNVVAPGFIETDMNYQVPDEIREKILKTIPLRRWGEPHEVADMVAFLVEKGDYVTGHLFTVDGGYTI